MKNQKNAPSSERQLSIFDALEKNCDKLEKEVIKELYLLIIQNLLINKKLKKLCTDLKKSNGELSPYTLQQLKRLIHETYKFQTNQKNLVKDLSTLKSL